MEIKQGIIKRYLNHVAAYIADHGWLPDDVTEYYDYVIDMKKRAASDGNLEILLIAIDCLLLNPSLDAPSFAETHNIYDPEEMEELLRYIRSVAFSDAPSTDLEIIRNVKFVGGIIFDAEVKLPV
jgi:hypothetical protein